MTAAAGGASGIEHARGVFMGTGRRSDSRRVLGMGSIGALYGILTGGSQCLCSVSVSTRCLARTIARCSSLISRIMHRKSARGRRSF